MNPKTLLVEELVNAILDAKFAGDISSETLLRAELATRAKPYLYADAKPRRPAAVPADPQLKLFGGD